MRNWIPFLLAFCGLVGSAAAQSSFSRFNFTIGGGPGFGRTYVANFVGDSSFGVVGGGMNFSRMFGMDAEYMYYDLSIRPSVSLTQSLNNASGNLQSISLDGIVHAPLHTKFGAYGIFGVGFYRRSVSATRTPLVPGTICQPAWSRWWGINCVNNNPAGVPVIPSEPPQALSSYSKNAGGFNAGGGITYPLPHLGHAKAFIEVRYHRAYQSDAQTAVVPVALGLRW